MLHGKPFAIGVTERSDPGRNMRWVVNIPNVNGVIVITKTITRQLGAVITSNMASKPMLIHCTCTGWGGTQVEPNAFPYGTQIESLVHLIQAGFPAQQCVLRIDPIIPTQEGLNRVQSVLNEFTRVLYPLGVNRIRISIMDEYRHVKERLNKAGIGQFYPGNAFYASAEQMNLVIHLFHTFHQKYSDVQIETCAETKLVQMAHSQGLNNLFETLGCVSLKDTDLMGLGEEARKYEISHNPQKRNGCNCCSFKVEMYPQQERKSCPNGCLYCFWKG